MWHGLDLFILVWASPGVSSVIFGVQSADSGTCTQRISSDGLSIVDKVFPSDSVPGRYYIFLARNHSSQSVFVVY